MGRKHVPVALFALVAAGCMPGRAALTEPESSRPVRVVAVVQGAEQDALWLSGITRAAERATLGLPLPGRLASRAVRVGDRVERGTVLARLDSRSWQNAVDASRAVVTGLELQLVQLDRDLDRLTKLDARGSIASAERERLETDRNALVASIAAAAAQRQEAERQLHDSVLTAPFDGVVLSVHAQAGETLSAGQPVVGLTGLGLEVAVELPETIWVRLVGDEAISVYLPALDETSRGHAIDLGSAAGGPGGLFPLVVGLEQGPRRVPGLTAKVELQVPVSPDPVVPVRAVIDPTGTAPAVFAVRDGRAVWVPVQLGTLRGDHIALSGVAVGERVVVAGHGQLLDGDAVEVVP